MYNLGLLKTEFTSKRDTIVRKQGQYERLLKEKELTQKQVDELQAEQTKLSNCVDVFHKISEQVTGKTKSLFEKLITEGLNLAFPESNQRALLEYGKRGNAVELDFYIEKQDGKGKWMKIDPYRGYSGGVANVYSFILRLILLLHNKANTLKTLVLDECLIHVSKNFQPNVLKLLRSLGIQVIFVTHVDGYAEGGDHTINVELKDGQSLLSYTTGT